MNNLLDSDWTQEMTESEERPIETIQIRVLGEIMD